jgi:hypothetical protein
MLRTESIVVYLVWTVATIFGVFAADNGHDVLASVILPLPSLLSFYVLTFRYGPFIFNSSSKDDGKVNYADLLVCTLVWVFAVANLLLLTWLWDREGAFANIAQVSVVEAWMRMVNLALLFAPGVGQGYATFISLWSESVAAYTTIISNAFMLAHVTVGLSNYKQYISEPGINKRVV